MDRRRPLRYLVVGGINSAFGYLSTVALYFLLSPGLSVFVIGLIATVINISFSFVTYKLFVFRTHGHWLEEYLKSFAVYGVAGVISAAALWGLVERFAVPIWWAQALCMVGVVAISYLGHSRFTFHRPAAPAVTGRGDD